MPFLVPILNNADQFFVLVIITGFYLHHVEVTNHESANGSLKAVHTQIILVKYVLGVFHVFNFF